MSRTLIPAGAHIICEHGSHVLLMRRSSTVDTWPNFWAFPGGKIEHAEFLREAAIRETCEEIGIIVDPAHILDDLCMMTRTHQGVKLVYFARVHQYDNQPEIRERGLATDLAWFPIDELPSQIIPHHRMAFESLCAGVHYREVDFTLHS